MHQAMKARDREEFGHMTYMQYYNQLFWLFDALPNHSPMIWLRDEQAVQLTVLS